MDNVRFFLFQQATDYILPPGPSGEGTERKIKQSGFPLCPWPDISAPALPLLCHYYSHRIALGPRQGKKEEEGGRKPQRNPPPLGPVRVLFPAPHQSEKATLHLLYSSRF